MLSGRVRQFGVVGYEPAAEAELVGRSAERDRKRTEVAVDNFGQSQREIARFRERMDLRRPTTAGKVAEVEEVVPDWRPSKDQYIEVSNPR